jgi:two-component system nitrogen regulation sensor histidine kinase GlnL
MPRDLSGVLDAVLAGIVVLDGRPVEALLGADHSLAKLSRSVLDSGRSAAENECQVERRSGTPLAVDVVVSPLFGDDGTLDGAVAFLRDSTIQRSLHRVVTERESLSAFGHIAAGVAHEVKNPLGGIRGAAEIVGARADDDRTRTAAKLIVREVDRIASLVDELMAFTHGEAVRPVPTNVHRVLDDVLDLLALDPLARGVELRRLYDPSIPELLLDPDRMNQVFLNLARNAFQAMEEDGGTLSITTRMQLDRRLTTAEGEQRPTVRVEFADTGPGIAEEALEKLATPFFTTRAGGTGLGLALSRHWVARHDGTLRIESAPGEGTRVRVDLPLRTLP